jgi:hypothetical protein
VAVVLRRGLTRSAADDVRYIVGTYDKDAAPDDQRLYLNGARVAQMTDTQPIGIGRHVSGIADPFIGHSSTSSGSRTPSTPTAGSRPPGTR